MTDIVNAYFRRFYPTELDRSNDAVWRFRDGSRGGGWQYSGPESDIFPEMLCADGFSMSVQGHFGAYCYPNDDFSSDPYRTVEVKGPIGIFLFKEHEGFDGFGDGTRIYADVPVTFVETIIETHGGLFDWNVADLGPLWSPQWEADCLRWRGRILTGKHGHWCADYDELPVDETCQEWPCVCASELDAKP